jgi:hypothetical protein
MAQGKFGGGTGIQENPYLIEDVEDLNAVRLFPNAHYKLATSINLGIYPYNTGQGWMPIKDFTGTFNGNSKKIFNLYINRPTKDNCGLFETIKQVDGTNNIRVFDLCMEDADVTGKSNAGILAGSLGIYQTTGAIPTPFIIERCYFTGKVKAEDKGGGAIGYIFWNVGSIAGIYNLAQDCFFDVTLQPNTMSSNFANVAGLIDNASNKNFTVNNLLSASNFIAVVNGLSAPALAPKVFANLNGYATWNSSVDCYYDNQRWTFGALTATGKTTDEMTKTRFSNIELRLLDDGTMIWDYEEGVRYPMLRQFFMDRYFIRTSQGYCVYENGSWLIKYTTMPTRAQAVKNGMFKINHIPQTAWDVLRLSESSVDIINVLEISNGTTQQNGVYTMNLDATVSVADKNYFRKEVQFSDFGHSIVTMNKGVTA